MVESMPCLYRCPCINALGFMMNLSRYGATKQYIYNLYIIIRDLFDSLFKPNFPARMQTMAVANQDLSGEKGYPQHRRRTNLHFRAMVGLWGFRKRISQQLHVVKGRPG
jgi:hypothetical protein